MAKMGIVSENYKADNRIVEKTRMATYKAAVNITVADDKLIVVASEDFARKTSTSKPSYPVEGKETDCVPVANVTPIVVPLYISPSLSVLHDTKRVAVATNMPIIYLFTFIIYLLTD